MLRRSYAVGCVFDDAARTPSKLMYAAAADWWTSFRMITNLRPGAALQGEVDCRSTFPLSDSSEM